MNVVSAAATIANADATERSYILHEAKYALLAAVLFVIFNASWMDSLIASVFPAGKKGPLLVLYKVILFVAIYYILQKTDWFQAL
jgi:hypothetical protein